MLGFFLARAGRIGGMEPNPQQSASHAKQTGITAMGDIRHDCRYRGLGYRHSDVDGAGLSSRHHGTLSITLGGQEERAVPNCNYPGVNFRVLLPYRPLCDLHGHSHDGVPGVKAAGRKRTLVDHITTG